MNDELNVTDEAEAILVVQQAIKVGEAQGVTEGLLIGMVSPIGRFVLYVDPTTHDTDSGFPVFTDAKEAAKWIVTADREDAYQMREVALAIGNWGRLATATLESPALYELGEALVTAMRKVSGTNPFDEDSDWG